MSGTDNPSVILQRDGGVLTNTLNARPIAGPMKMVGNPIKFSQTPIENNSAPPQVRQHTDEALREWLGLQVELAGAQSGSEGAA